MVRDRGSKGMDGCPLTEDIVLFALESDTCKCMDAKQLRG
jgi:hypothetical protein